MAILSFIIPHKNDAERCLHLIDSIQQNVSSNDVKIIVVDDYSNEEQFNNLVTSILDAEVLIYRNAGKASAGSARNIGIDHANTPFIAFADSDDFVLPTLAAVVERLKSSNDAPDIHFYLPKGHRQDNIKRAKRQEPYVSLVKNYIEDGIEDIRYRFVVPWSKIYKTSFIKANKLAFDSCIASNDVMFSLKAGILAGRISVSLEAFYVVVERPNSLITKKSKVIMKSRLLAAMRYNKYLLKTSPKLKRFQLSLLGYFKNYASHFGVLLSIKIATAFVRRNWRIM